MPDKHGGDIYSYKKGILDFSANINPFGMPEGVKRAIIDSIEAVIQYPDVECRELREKISQKEKIDKESIICGNGAAELIFNLCLTLKPKKALILAPTFSEYEQGLDTIKAEKIFYNLKEENDFIIDKDILKYLNEDIDIIFLCNPNNPTGSVIKKELLNQIIDKCKENNIFIVLDECFNDFLEDRELYTAKDKIKENDKLFILRAFTKMYAMAGIRLGYGLCSNKRLLDALKKSRQPWSVSTLAQRGGIAALEEEEFAEKTRKYIANEKEFLYKGFEKLNIRYFKSMANYIFFKADKGLDKSFIDKNILIRNCDNYRNLKEGYYRIAVKAHNENEIFFKALKEILGGK